MDTVKLAVPTVIFKYGIASIFLIKAFKYVNLTPPFLLTIR